MATIKKLTLQGFKRQYVVEELSGKDIFIGPNGVGKSSRIQSLGTALLGYVPGSPGKRPQDTFRVATAEEMVVGLETDEFRFDRSYARKVKTKRDGSKEVSVSQKINVSPALGESTLKAKEQRISKEMGNFPVMLDFGEFLSMSDSERRSFFYNLAGIDAETWTKDDVALTLEGKLLPAELEENNPDAYEAQRKTIDEALAEWREGLDPETGVRAMLEWAKAKQKHWNAEKRKATGAVQKLAELKNKLEETDRNINQNREELERLQRELTTVSEEISRQREAQKAVTRRLARMEELRKKIVELSNQEDALDPASLEQEIKALNDQITDGIDVKAETIKISDEIAAYESELEKLSTKITHETELLAQARGKAQGLAQSIEQASERGGTCVIASNISCPKDFTPYVDWAKGELTNHNDETSQKQDLINDMNKRRRELRNKIQDLQKQRDAIYTRARGQDQQNESLRQKIRECEKQIDKIKSDHQLREERIKDYQTELAEHEAEPVEDVVTSDILIKQKDGLSNQIEELKAKLQEQEKARTTIGNMKASMIDSTTAENYHSAAKYLVEELGPKGIQGVMLVSSLGPIRDDVTSNLRAMGVENPFFFQTESDRGQEVFRFGWIDDEDREVDFDALSTGQQMIVLLALLVTILDRANPSCKVLAIDNIENLDSENVHRVLLGLDVLSERLDNILLAGVLELNDIPGWTIHRLGQTKREEGVA